MTSASNHDQPRSASTAAPMVEAVGVRKSFGRTEVLRGIDLTVDAAT